MKLEPFIARRLAASGTRSFSRMIIRIAIIAIALSLTVMITATALIRGFQNQISSKIFGFWGHIHITDTNLSRSFDAIPIDAQQDFYPALDTVGSVSYVGPLRVLGIEWDNQMVERETHGGIRHIQVFAHHPGIIKTKDQIEGIIIKGIGPDFDWKNLENYLEEGRAISYPDSSASQDIIISRQTANRLKLGVGDRFEVNYIEDGEQLRRRYGVCGIYKTGLEEYDQKFALVDIRQLQQVLGWREDQVGGFEVFVDDIRDMDIINEYIYLEVIPGDLFSETIRDKFPAIFDWLGLQDINEVVILVLMLIVALINMITALMILILERTNMIGILKALGQSDWGIRQIFLYHAAYIIAIGLFWGNLIGLGLCWIQKKFEIVRLSEADYYLSVAPVEFHFWTIFSLNLGTLAVVIVFLIIPSYMVTRITPVSAIRFK
ncbi:MAG: FtsX-like permease family protein [Bacteroidota bacterium]